MSSVEANQPSQVNVNRILSLFFLKYERVNIQTLTGAALDEFGDAADGAIFKTQVFAALVAAGLITIRIYQGDYLSGYEYERATVYYKGASLPFLPVTHRIALVKKLYPQACE
jgi:hypothetical protein